jgi:DNA-binding transcriptional regulator LsrR (DeoR family)
VTDFVEMFRHWHAGRSQMQIHEALHIDRKTIRKYVAPAIAEGLGQHRTRRSMSSCGGNGSGVGFPG